MDNITNTSVEMAVGGDGLIPMIIPPRWAYNLELVLMLIVFLVGIPGNTIIIIVQSKTANKTSTDYLVLIMAMYELICSSANTLVRMFEDIHVVWLLVSSDFICKFAPALYYLAQYGSAQMLGMLAVDRCIKTVFPLSSWYGKNQALGVSAIILLISITLSAPRPITHTVHTETLMCAFTEENMMMGKYFGIAGSILSLIIFIVLTVAYSVIAISLKRRHLKKVQQRKGQKARAAPNPGNTEEDFTTMSTTEVSNETCVTDQGTVAVEMSKDVNVKTEEKKVSSGKSTKPSKSKMLTLEGRNLNRLTVLMFLMSLIYVASNSVLWFLFITSPFLLGEATLYLSFTIPMLNCISNPILFFSMSSRFRSNVKTLLRCR